MLVSSNNYNTNRQKIQTNSLNFKQEINSQSTVNSILHHSVAASNLDKPDLNKSQDTSVDKASYREWLYDLQDAEIALLRDIFTVNRLQTCQREPISKNGKVEVFNDNGNSWFTGLKSCRLAWLCPLRANYKGWQDRQAIKAAIDQWEEKGGIVLLVTYSPSHETNTSLATALDVVQDGYKKLHQLRAYRSIKADCGLYGTVRSLEVVYDQNHQWWLPHLHELAFINDPNIAIAPFEADMLQLWVESVNKAASAANIGCYPNEKSLHVTDSFRGEYIAKGVAKSDKPGVLSSWELLDEFRETGDLEPGNLFKEYAVALRGKHQIEDRQKLLPKPRKVQKSDQAGKPVLKLTSQQWKGFDRTEILRASSEIQKARAA